MESGAGFRLCEARSGGSVVVGVGGGVVREVVGEGQRAAWALGISTRNARVQTLDRRCCILVSDRRRS